jgi:hypothetical protein
LKESHTLDTPTGLSCLPALSRIFDLAWIPDEKLLDLNLWESDHIFFPWIREGKFFSAKFEYEGDEMRGYNVVFYTNSTNPI